VDQLQMSCKHISLELRPKTSKTVSSAYMNEARLFQMVETQHENRRAAMFVNEDCVDSRSDVDDLRTRDCLYDKGRQVIYEGCCSLTAL